MVYETSQVTNELIITIHEDQLIHLTRVVCVHILQIKYTAIWESNQTVSNFGSDNLQ